MTQNRCLWIGRQEVSTWEDIRRLSPQVPRSLTQTSTALRWAQEPSPTSCLPWIYINGPNGKPLVICCKLSDTVDSVMRKIGTSFRASVLGTQSDRLVEETDGSQMIMQQLKFKGNELEDYEKTLTDYKIQFESTIDMQVSGLFMRGMGAWIPDKMMSVAAGGTIKQSIIEDKNDPRVWNTDKVKLINVQIINSALFEEITGMAMPPTPVSLQTYVSKGLPFFDIYNETPTNVTGSFGNVRTVSEMDSVRGARASMVYDPTRPQICGACSVRMRDCMSVTFCYSLFYPWIP